MKKVLITGVAGFIGSHTADFFLENGYFVVGIDDLSTGKIENLVISGKSNNFTFIESDVLDEEAFFGFCKDFGIDVIVHLAGLVSVILAEEEPQKNFELNVLSTQIVLETARKLGIKRVVYSSSASVYGENTDLPLNEDSKCDPISQYGSAKLVSEKLMRSYSISYGLECVALRYFNIYGERQDPKSPYSGVISIFMDRIKQGEGAIIFGDGEQSRDFINVRDIARANYLGGTKNMVGENVFNVFNVSSSKSTTINHLFKTISSFSSLNSSLTATYKKARDKEILHSLGDNSRVSSSLGFSNTVELAEGLASLYKHIRSC